MASLAEDEWRSRNLNNNEFLSIERGREDGEDYVVRWEIIF